MKLAIILSTNQLEANWNAFRLANLALTKGDEVNVFLIGEAVEYDKVSNEQFNIKKQVELFLQSEKAKIVACGTCMNIRHKQSTKSCPMGSLQDLYSLITENNKILTF